MSHNYTVARPYAKAIFQQAQAQSQLNEWSALLECLDLITADHRIKQFIADPAVSNVQVITVITDVLKEALPEIAKACEAQLHNLLLLLAKAKRFTRLSDIAAQYHQLLAESEAVVHVEVVSAKALTQTQQAEFQKSLEKRFSRNIEIEYKEDQSIIGGALIRAGSWVMDGSVKGKLARLAGCLRD